MPNHYTDWFTQNGPNNSLYEDLINEAVDFYGVEAQYMIRESLTNFDTLFGDDPAKLFKQAYPVTVYVQTVDQFEGFEMMTKFGYEVRKQARFLVANRAFGQSMPEAFGRPREGDILYLTQFKAFFEIKKADEEHIFYTFGKNDIYGYSLVCEKWNYDQATVNTTVEQIDSIIANVVIAYAFTMDIGGSGTYELSEEVMGDQSGAFATVNSWNVPNSNLVLDSIVGEFIVGETLVGQNSNAQFVLNTLNIRDSVNDQLDDNQTIANEADNILIFSPDNPFGEPQT